MSRSKFEKLVNEMPKKDLVELVMNLYDAKKEAKDYFEYFLNPDEEKAAEKCRAVFVKEFTKTGVRPPKGRISKCKKALDAFEALHPSVERRIDLRLYLADLASKYGLRNYRIWEKCCKTIEKKFRETLVLIADFGAVDAFRPRIDQLQNQAERAGFWLLEKEEIDDLLASGIKQKEKKAKG